eukprot:9309391-Alexandrium_andersonii.AAC.1
MLRHGPTTRYTAQPAFSARRPNRDRNFFFSALLRGKLRVVLCTKTSQTEKGGTSVHASAKAAASCRLPTGRRQLDTRVA